MSGVSNSITKSNVNKSNTGVLSNVGNSSISNNISKSSGNSSALSDIISNYPVNSNSVKSNTALSSNTNSSIASSLKSNVALPSNTNSSIASSLKSNIALPSNTNSSIASSVKSNTALPSNTNSSIASSVKSNVALPSNTNSSIASSVKSNVALPSNTNSSIASSVKSNVALPSNTNSSIASSLKSNLTNSINTIEKKLDNVSNSITSISNKFPISGVSPASLLEDNNKSNVSNKNTANSITNSNIDSIISNVNNSMANNLIDSNSITNKSNVGNSMSSNTNASNTNASNTNKSNVGNSIASKSSVNNSNASSKNISDSINNSINAIEKNQKVILDNALNSITSVSNKIPISGVSPASLLGDNNKSNVSSKNTANSITNSNIDSIISNVNNSMANKSNVSNSMANKSNVSNSMSSNTTKSNVGNSIASKSNVNNSNASNAMSSKSNVISEDTKTTLLNIIKYANNKIEDDNAWLEISKKTINDSNAEKSQKQLAVINEKQAKESISFLTQKIGEINKLLKQNISMDDAMNFKNRMIDETKALNARYKAERDNVFKGNSVGMSEIISSVDDSQIGGVTDPNTRKINSNLISINDKLNEINDMLKPLKGKQQYKSVIAELIKQEDIFRKKKDEYSRLLNATNGRKYKLDNFKPRVDELGKEMDPIYKNYDIFKSAFDIKKQQNNSLVNNDKKPIVDENNTSIVNNLQNKSGDNPVVNPPSKVVDSVQPLNNTTSATQNTGNSTTAAESLSRKAQNVATDDQKNMTTFADNNTNTQNNQSKSKSATTSNSSDSNTQNNDTIKSNTANENVSPADSLAIHAQNENTNISNGNIQNNTTSEQSKNNTTTNNTESQTKLQNNSLNGNTIVPNTTNNSASIQSDKPENCNTVDNLKFYNRTIDLFYRANKNDNYKETYLQNDKEIDLMKNKCEIFNSSIDKNKLDEEINKMKKRLNDEQEKLKLKDDEIFNEYKKKIIKFHDDIENQLKNMGNEELKEKLLEIKNKMYNIIKKLETLKKNFDIDYEKKQVLNEKNTNLSEWMLKYEFLKTYIDKTIGDLKIQIDTIIEKNEKYKRDTNTKQFKPFSNEIKESSQPASLKPSASLSASSTPSASLSSSLKPSASLSAPSTPATVKQPTFPDNKTVMKNTLQYYNCEVYLLTKDNKNPIIKKDEVIRSIEGIKNTIEEIKKDDSIVSENINGLNNSNFNEGTLVYDKPTEIAVMVVACGIKIDPSTNNFVPLDKDDTNLNRMIFYLNHNHFWEFLISVDKEKCSIKSSSPNTKSNWNKLPKFDPKSLKNNGTKVEYFKDWSKIMGKGIFGGSPSHYPFGGNLLPSNLITNGYQSGGEPCNSQIKRIVDSVLALAGTKYEPTEYSRLKTTFKQLLEHNIETEILINQKVQQLQQLSQSGSLSSSNDGKLIVDELQKLLKLMGDNENKIFNNVQITYTKINPTVPVGISVYESLTKK